LRKKGTTKKGKNMAEKEYAYYPGCSLEGTGIAYGQSIRLVLKALGADLPEPPDWSCCGSTPAHAVDHLLAGALAARNLVLVEKMGLKGITAPCPSCFSALKTTHYRMAKNKVFKEEVNELLDSPYGGSVEVRSTLQFIYENIGVEEVARAVKVALPNMKVAPYYGCILNRPPELAQFDDPENPISMDRLISAVGVDVVDYAFKMECCGAAFGVPRKDMVNKLTHKVLSMAIDAGANCIAVACPLCQQNLDLRQAQVNSAMGSSFNIPVLYFSQIMGLTYGFTPKELGIDKGIVDPGKLIETGPILPKEVEKPKKSKAAAKEAS
jgi:heterodisulfide reductase subunit B2